MSGFLQRTLFIKVHHEGGEDGKAQKNYPNSQKESPLQH
jgi:hypothetical protein